MDAVLVDTDVFSYFLKGDSRAELYRRHLERKTIALSFVTIGELFFWTIRRKWSSKRIASLEQQIRMTVVIPYDVELCREYGRVKGSVEARVIPANDLWIAACAIRHSIPLVSHNRAHFEGIPRLVVISEAN